MMRHRHLDYPPDTEPQDLPSAALADILDRGDVADWLPLARAVSRDPRGPLAARLTMLVDAFPMYGTSPLWRAWIARGTVRADARAAARSGVTARRATLAQARRSTGLTQAEVAARLGISQSDVSKIEQRRDVKLSTLRRYLGALDGRVRILAAFDHGPPEQLEVDLGS